MRISVLIVSTLLFSSSCLGTEQNQKEAKQIEVNQDSLQKIANYFLTFNEFINSYEISDRDIDEVYQVHSEWVLKFFPTILNKYDMTLYSQFTIASYLFLENERVYLKDLWKKYKKFSGDSAKGKVPNEEFKPVLNLISEFGISIADLD